eukprot:scaffold77466_cov102-Cyclotella_meneghiniana.AAC.1
MSTSAYKALTRDECYSIITKKRPPLNHGRAPELSWPSRHDQQTFLSNVIQDIPCDYSAFGYLHKILPQNTYQQKAQWDQSINVNLALIDFARSAFDGEFQRTLNNLVRVASSKIFLTWFNNIFDQYGKASPKDITSNENNMNLPWNPAQRDFASAIRQIEDASIFASFISQPKADHDLSNAALKIVTDTGGMFPLQLMTWYEEDDGTKTFNNLMIFFISKINVWYRAGCTTASQAGYAGNVNSEETNKACLVRHELTVSLGQKS